jgi:O-antigen ligase
VSGPVHDPDDLAFFLIAAVPLVGTARAHRGRSMWPVWAAAAVLLAGILGSHSRGAYAAVVALVVVAMATRVLAIRYAGILLALLATCAALALAVLPHDLHGALDQQQRFAEDKVAHRLDLWHAAATMTREHPALGLGPGAFARYHLDYGDEEREAAERDLDDAHSTVLQASSELGVIGAVALLGLFLVPAAAAWRRWQRDRSQLAAATCLAVAGALVASSLETEQFRLPLWFLAALAAALGHERRHRMALLGDSSSGQVVARK